MTINELIAQQQQTVAALRKRIAGIDSMMAQGQQERDALVADIIKEMGHLEGLQAAAAIPAEKVDLSNSGIIGEKKGAE